MSTKNPILSIRKLSVIRGDKTIHDELDLDLYEGEILVVLGESGSGKTMLLRTLVGLEATQGGTCQFDDKDLYALDRAQWPQIMRDIAYAFQAGALFDSLTVMENLEFPLLEHTKLKKKERAERVVKQLTALGLGRIENQMPSELSGGMQKRVGVARAIILDPKIILYDEPTAGLDPTNIGRINETILRLQELGKSSVVVTHDPLCALEVADRFVFLEKGKIAAEQSRADYDIEPHPRLLAYFTGNKKIDRKKVNQTIQPESV